MWHETQTSAPEFRPVAGLVPIGWSTSLSQHEKTRPNIGPDDGTQEPFLCTPAERYQAAGRGADGSSAEPLPQLDGCHPLVPGHPKRSKPRFQPRFVKFGKAIWSLLWNQVSFRRGTREGRVIFGSQVTEHIFVFQLRSPWLPNWQSQESLKPCQRETVYAFRTNRFRGARGTFVFSVRPDPDLDLLGLHVYMPLFPMKTDGRSVAVL